MKLIQYKDKRGNGKFKILTNKKTAYQLLGVSEFNTLEDLVLSLINEGPGSNTWSYFPRPTGPVINNNRKRYKVLHKFKDFAELKSIYAEYLI